MNQMGFAIMDLWEWQLGEHTEDEETNHAFMASLNTNEIYEKDEKLKRYRRIGMKAVKEKEQLQKTLDSWKDSSKNLWRLINSGMSSNSKVGLGCSTSLSGDHTSTHKQHYEVLYMFNEKGNLKNAEPNEVDDMIQRMFLPVIYDSAGSI
ncbi:hypothetical protein Tco_1282244 [Tanacetum coccineum]